MNLGHTARAASTLKQYKPHWDRFCLWCLKHGYQDPYSLPPRLVSLHITEVFKAAKERHVGHGVIKATSASIGYHFLARGLPSPTEKDPACGIVRSAAARTLIGKHLDRDPMTLEQLNQAALTVISRDMSLTDLMAITATSLAFGGLLRPSEACSILVHQDLLKISKDFVEFFIPSSKTDQFYEGAWAQVAAVPGSVYCPVLLTTALLSRGKFVTAPEQGQDAGPLLRATCMGPNGLEQLHQTTASLSDPIPAWNYTTFLKNFRSMTSRAGLPPSILPHSMRIGGAQQGAVSGVPERLIMYQGRWKSVATLHVYLAGAQRVACASLAFGVAQ
jgi:hypothetical protein